MVGGRVTFLCVCGKRREHLDHGGGVGVEVRGSSPSTFNMVLGIKPIIRLGQQALVLLNHPADPQVLHISLEYLPERGRVIKKTSKSDKRAEQRIPNLRAGLWAWEADSRVEGRKVSTD